MKRETYVSIPQPCHENWDAMTPQDKGRFCAGCAKTVVDFSGMSDTQVLEFLSQSKGRVCGRFAQDQVERPLISIKKEKKKIWWMAALMPLTLLLNRANGQLTNDKKIKKDVGYTIAEKSMGLVAVGTHQANNIVQGNDKVIIGTIVGENKQPLAGASITIKGIQAGTTTDASGKFLLSFSTNDHSATISISYVGYESKEVSYAFTNSDVVDINTQSLQPTSMGEVVVVGMFMPYHSVKKIDTIKTTVRKILKVNPFKVYPNPVFRGAEVNIEFRKEGHYSVQVLDLNSKLITQKSLYDTQGATKTSITIPSSITPGIYFIRLINDDIKQQFTEKIIVQ